MKIFGKKRYEYMILTSSGLINSEQLNERAKDGWRLVGIVLSVKAYEYDYYFYFERLI